MSQSFFRTFAVFVSILSLAGCGYSFQYTHNPLQEREGIEKVYVSSFVNNTYKPGVENLIYNSVVRVLKSSGRLKVVQDPALADAVLSGTVTAASYGRSSGSTVSNLKPANLGSTLPTADFVVSVEYNATLNCDFVLSRRHPRPDQSLKVWSSGFSRAKTFPASNQLSVPGTTSSLINESEFDRALSDLAKNMMEDLQESMFAMF